MSQGDDPVDDDRKRHGAGPALTRRSALQVGAVLTTAPLTGEAVAAPRIYPLMARPAAPGQTMKLGVTINGRQFEAEIDARTSLLDLLRERFDLTGAKKGCDHGQCGACTVHIDGRRVVSCLTLAAKVDGRRVTTIEGLSDGKHLHPMQQAFIDQDAFQCGYCTPGQILSAVACVHEGHAETDDQAREYMSGNLCRCAAYPHIVAAIAQAKPQMKA